MLTRLLRFAGAAAAVAAAFCAGAAHAQPNSRLGWLTELAGACWQGRDAAGAAVDRQCHQLQFGRFLRTSISRVDGFSGESVLGWSRERGQLEMYAWSNQASPAIFTPHFQNGALIFAGAEENAVATRALWRRNESGGFDLVEQAREAGAWTDRSVVAYTRDGSAPAAFAAGTGPAAQGRSAPAFSWLNVIAGRCYRQTQPDNNRAHRGCFAWQYPTILRQTWYWSEDGAPTGESVMFAADGALRFYHWDAQGNFGVGHSVWDDQRLLSTTDSAGLRRTVLERRGGGLQLTTQSRGEGPNSVWAPETRYRFAQQ
jgi:hypothetical protein